MNKDNKTKCAKQFIRCIKRGTLIYPVLEEKRGISANEPTIFVTIFDYTDDEYPFISCNTKMYPVIVVPIEEIKEKLIEALIMYHPKKDILKKLKEYNLLNL